MICLDLTLDDPRANLALEEALLEEVDTANSGEILRFWESPTYFVVLGAGGLVEKDVNVAACEAACIPILRRCSGGGTVLQGPGCFNYTLVLKKEIHPELSGIGSTNCYVLQRIGKALRLAGIHSEIRGTSDLVCEGSKISGNAQRRKRNTILFHGTLLHSFDLELISRLLREPERQPEYRGHRPHREFIRNAGISPELLRRTIKTEWGCVESADYLPPLEQVRSLVEMKYASRKWNYSL